MGCACSAPADDFDDVLEPDAFTGPSRTMLARPKPRVLAVIAAWHASDETETASAIPRTRSKTRPGPLAEVAGEPMVFHAWHAAHAAKCVTRCVVATDDDAVETAALAFGARVVRVDEKRRSEKELKNRFASVAAAARATAATRRAFDAVVVVDADEAFVEAHHIERVADAVIDSDAQSATCVRARDAFDARNDAGRVFLVVAEPTRATPKTKTTSVETRARYVARVFSETDASAEAARFEENEENENGRASPTRERSRSPKSPLASSREEDEKKNASASRASSKKDDAKKKKEAFFSVGVEVGVRSYVASALLETLELCEQKKKKKTIKTASSASLGRGPRDEDEAFFAKRRTRSSASGDEADGEEEKNQRRRRDDHLGPTREALLLGWRVAAVRSEESSDRNLGGLKTQRSLDAKNARIRAGEIRLAHALEDATRRRRR